jgi:enamine deaminase RidA (YjgF/YER057c/UK114 family)
MPGMNDEEILGRIRKLGLELPPPPEAVAAYLPCVVHGSLAFVAGQIAMTGSEVLHPGSLGDGVGLGEGVEAARQAALQALSALREALGGSFERVERILQVTVFVASVTGFVEHPKVANGASELLAEILGEAGRHARAAVGVPSLPLGAPVELVMTAAVRAAT